MADIFLTAQPIWHLHVNDQESLKNERALDIIWESGVSENDPGDEQDLVRKGAGFEDERFQRMMEMEGGEEAVNRKESLFDWSRLSSDEARESDRSADRDIMIDHAVSDQTDWKRVLLVCGAGYGKTTNLEWLAAELNGEERRDDKNFAIFDELHGLINNLASDEGRISVVQYVANKLETWGGFSKEEATSQASRLISRGRITFLLDSLDQADRPRAMDAILQLHRDAPECRIWISGRPYAFRETEKSLRKMAHWQFLRIAPLEEPECRQLLEYHRTNRLGSVWSMAEQVGKQEHLYDVLHRDAGPQVQELARIPRFGRLIGQMGPWQFSRLRSTASAFWELYAFVNPGDINKTGLLDSGLDRGAQFLGTIGKDPDDPSDRRLDRNGKNVARINNPDYRKWQRTLATAFLGAVAFEMYVMGNEKEQPLDRVDGDLKTFLKRVRKRMVRCGAYRNQHGNRICKDDDDALDNIANFDWKRITTLNAQGLQHITLSNCVDPSGNKSAGGERILFADISTQAFFAAYWAVRWADKKDRKQTRGWIYDSWDEKDKRYAEFWEMAIGLRAVQPWPGAQEVPFKQKPWVQLFAPMYDISKQADPKRPRRATQWIYQSWKAMDGTKAKAAFQSEFLSLLDSGDAIAKSILADPATGKSRFIQLADPANPRDDWDTGQFRMGAPADEDPNWDTRFKGRGQDNPQHDVQLSAFRMNEYCVTNQQFEKFSPSHIDQREFETSGRNVKDHPVVNVSWYDAWCFAKWLGALEIDDVQIQIRLPTEAQWEYACRCGESTSFTWPNRENGGQILSGYANFDGNFEWPFGAKSDNESAYLERTIRVDGVDDKLSVAANPWGLHQMHGNMWEWCWDWYERYSDDEASNPTGPNNGSTRVLRGGCWISIGRDLRSADRNGDAPSYRSRDFGFRLAAVPLSAASSAEQA